MKAILWEVRGMGKDVSEAKSQGVDTPKADPPKGADSVHEQTRKKGEKARREREKVEQEATREQNKRNHEDGLEAPPGD
jgi:hypothetical protein